MAIAAAALTFVLVFGGIWKLGQPWVKYGWPQRIGERASYPPYPPTHPDGSLRVDLPPRYRPHVSTWTE